jgi:glutamate racemase
MTHPENPPDPAAAAPIGVFDSGVGGLSVLRQIRLLMPGEDVLFFADQAHVPYGPRALDEVRQFALGIARFLVARGAKIVVVACNTASAAALRDLRAALPGTPFVGMEPAVKPAAERTRTRTVGVLATSATFQGALFESVVERFAQGVVVIPRTLPGLVEQIESGDLDGEVTRLIVETGVRPLVARGADTLVLACTHYPFVIPLIQAVAGDDVEVIDPSPAIARQAARVLAERGLAASVGHGGRLTLVSTGDADRLGAMAARLIGADGETRGAVWDAGGTDTSVRGQ